MQVTLSVLPASRLARTSSTAAKSGVPVPRISAIRSSVSVPHAPSLQRKTRSPGLGGELEEVGLLVADAVEGLEDEVAVRVGPRLLLGDPALVDERLDEGVVVGELAQLAAAVEVGAAVADVTEPEAGAVEERDGGGGGGAVEGGVLLDQLGDPVVGAVHGTGDLAEDVVVRLLVELAQRLHGRARGEVTADRAAHAVADRQQPRTGVAAVLVLAAHPADVGDRGVVEVHHFRSSRIVLPTRTWTPRPMVVGCVMRTGPT